MLLRWSLFLGVTAFLVSGPACTPAPRRYIAPFELATYDQLGEAVPECCWNAFRPGQYTFSRRRVHTLEHTYGLCTHTRACCLNGQVVTSLVMSTSLVCTMVGAWGHENRGVVPLVRCVCCVGSVISCAPTLSAWWHYLIPASAGATVGRLVPGLVGS